LNNFFKSQFFFSKNQRVGIFCLLSIVFFIQVLLYFKAKLKFINKDQPFSDQKVLNSKLNLEQKNVFVLHPFNPNFLTDYKGYQLGMSITEIDNVLKYRSEGMWINSNEKFKEVSGVSDSLMIQISKYFKYPNFKSKVKFRPKKKQDFNIASSQDFMRVKGIGPYYSKSIIKLRQELGGFTDFVQLKLIKGFNDDLVKKIKSTFTNRKPKQIIKLNINEATLEELVLIDFIDYEVAYNIIGYRLLLERYDSLEQLTKVEDFPLDKYDLIELYLSIE
jgi:competence protein ComEA